MSSTRQWFKTGFGKIVSYFLQGLLMLAPIFVTVLVLYKIFDSIDGTIEKVWRALFHFYFPGVGIVVMFFIIAAIGFVGSLVFMQPLLHVLDLLIERVPLVKDIYSSMKDFFGAFISKKKKFDKPVMFEVGKESGVFRLGLLHKMI